MASHAIRIEEKEARSKHILGVALELFLENTRRLPTVDAIASKSGLAKGTIYLYFSSKEHVFASLLAQQWHDLLSVVSDCFKAETGTQHMVGEFVSKFGRYLSSHPYFLRLDSMGYGLLEAKLPSDQFWAFKTQFVAHLKSAGAVIDHALSLDAGRGLKLLTRSYALTRGLWQLSDHPDTHRAHADFADHPFAQIDFDTDLKEALLQYWAGAVGAG
ncbi:MAG: TetR family transcriptional regulator [Pseudomonadota bacterium]